MCNSLMTSVATTLLALCTAWLASPLGLALAGEASSSAQGANVARAADPADLAQAAARADRLALGVQVVVTGFLAPRRRQSKSLVLHVTEFASPAALDDTINDTINEHH